MSKKLDETSTKPNKYDNNSVLASKLRSFFKENLSPLLFFGLIIFAILSIWINSTFSAQNAVNLANFADQSAPTVRTEIARITNKTLLIDNKPESYDELINDLNNFNKKLDDLSTQTPLQNSDEVSRKLQSDLTTFFQGVKQDNTHILDRVKKQKDLYQSSIDYGKIKSISNNGGTKEELQKAYEGASKIQEFQIDQNKGIENVSSKSANQASINANQQILDQLKDLLARTGDGALNLSDRDDIAKIFNNTWPLDTPTFPRISKDEFETQVFAQRIQQLQQDLDSLKKKFNLK